MGSDMAPVETTVEIIIGDALARTRELPDGSVQCCVTSPPYYGLRDYGVEGQIGMETTVNQYVARLTEVFSEVLRVLKSDGTLWLNLGDSYATGAGSARVAGGKCFGRQNKAIANFAFPRLQPNRMPQPGFKPKDLIGIPWRVAFALQTARWWLRSDCIWHKPNPMPESVSDRPTRAHEYVFLLSKAERYYYDAEAVRETGGPGDHRRSPKGRSLRSVWSLPASPYKGHFATFPPELARRCIVAGSRPGDTVLDPFAGSGTTGAVARELGRNAILIELQPDYHALIKKRLSSAQPPLFVEGAA